MFVRDNTIKMWFLLYRQNFLFFSFFFLRMTVNECKVCVLKKATEDIGSHCKVIVMVCERLKLGFEMTQQGGFDGFFNMFISFPL